MGRASCDLHSSSAAREASATACGARFVTADVRETPILTRNETHTATIGRGGPRRGLFVVNRLSRLGRFNIAAAARRLRLGGIELVETSCKDARDVSPLIREHANDVDCVIIAGGDGTINAAGRGLVETGLPLGVLPTGTANDFARSVGIPPDLDAAAHIIAAGIEHKVDIGEVNGHVFFNVASVGIAAELAKALTRADKRRFGRFSYALSAARLLARANPFHATLLTGNEKIMVRTMQIAVGNGRYYGGGNVIASDARIDDGRLDLYSLEFAQVWRMALLAPGFKSGRHGAVREVRTARGTTFEILTRKPKPVNADGELVTQTPAVFTQIPAAVGVYVPQTGPLIPVPPRG